MKIINIINIGLLLLLGVVMFLPTREPNIKSILATTEYTYMQGQKAAINGDIRIEKINDTYQWTTSCWEDKSTLYITEEEYVTSLLSDLKY